MRRQLRQWLLIALALSNPCIVRLTATQICVAAAAVVVVVGGTAFMPNATRRRHLSADTTVVAPRGVSGSSGSGANLAAHARVPLRVPRQLEEQVREDCRRRVGAGQHHERHLVGDLCVGQRRRALCRVAGDKPCQR